MNITAILAIFFYFAIIIIPLILVIRETIKEMSSIQNGIQNKKNKNNK